MRKALALSLKAKYTQQSIAFIKIHSLYTQALAYVWFCLIFLGIDFQVLCANHLRAHNHFGISDALSQSQLVGTL